MNELRRIAAIADVVLEGENIMSVTGRDGLENESETLQILNACSCLLSKDKEIFDRFVAYTRATLNKL